jgi:hypothetical protein
LQGEVDGLDAAGPEVGSPDATAAFDDGVVEEDLAVELERARLDGEGARRGAGAWRLVDDADFDAELGQPEGEHEAGRSGADDQNGLLHAYGSPRSFSRICRRGSRVTVRKDRLAETAGAV